MSSHPHVPPRLERLFPATPVFFITACTYRRRKVLANPIGHAAMAMFCERAYRDHNIAVGRYVIMPDHIHLFVCGPAEFELGRWIGMLKQSIQRSVTTHYEVPHLASPTGRRLQKKLVQRSHFWQRGFFDHVLRSEESYEQKWNYVRDNPVRAGLVTDADDWLFAGEIIQIDRV